MIESVKNIVIPSGFSSLSAGYIDGVANGIAAQKGKISPITITRNGTYENENGFSPVYVTVEGKGEEYEKGYEQGSSDGYDSTYATAFQNAYDEAYDRGEEAGMQYIKDELVEVTITKNGDNYYTSNWPGMKKITVNVPSAGTMANLYMRFLITFSEDVILPRSVLSTPSDLLLGADLGYAHIYQCNSANTDLKDKTLFDVVYNGLTIHAGTIFISQAAFDNGNPTGSDNAILDYGCGFCQYGGQMTVLGIYSENK